MYLDVYHPTGILSAAVYWVLDYIFPGNYLVYRMLALLLIFIQAVLFNVFLINHKAYNQNTYIPAAIYAILMMSIPDFATLSPQLMSLTFVLLAFDLTFRHIEGRRKRDWIILQIGFYFGLSTLFYSLNYLLLISTIFGFLFYTNTLFRRYILLLMGFMLPFLLLWTKFFWYGQQADFYFNLRYLFLPSGLHDLVSWQTMITVSIIPFLYLLFSFYKVLKAVAFINYQVRIQNFMFLILIIGALIIFLDYFQASHALVILVPSLAFYITHYFLLIRKAWISEIMFAMLISTLLFQNYGITKNLLFEKDWFNFEKLYFNPFEAAPEIKDKRILLLGQHTGEYYDNHLASPYLSWTMAIDQFNRMDRYPVVIKIYRKLNKDKPQILIDEAGIAGEIFERMPLLELQYREAGDKRYILK